MNGLDTLAVTKLDVLDPCHARAGGRGVSLQGTRLGEWPGDEQAIAALEPVFEERRDGSPRRRDCASWEDLPPRARDYLRWLEDLIECEISLVSTGPGRDETILVEPSNLTRWFPDLRRALPVIEATRS